MPPIRKRGLMKECGRCHKNLSIQSFSINRARKDGLSGICRQCTSDHFKTQYHNDVEFRSRDQARSLKWHAEKYHTDPVWRQKKLNQKLKTYGITRDVYDQMLQRQNGICPLCLQPMREPCIDHDHETGKVRGLICHTCNAHLISGIDRLQKLGRLNSLNDIVKYVLQFRRTQHEK